MNNLHKIVAWKRPKYFDPRSLEFLRNPLWYVIVVTGLAGLTMSLRLWWGVTGAVALLWGLWLVWQFFSDLGQPADDEADAQLRAWLRQALDYRAKIDQALQRADNNHNPLGEPALLPQIDAWVEIIQALTQRLALLRRDDLVRRDLATLPHLIQALELQLARTPEAPVRAHLEQALRHRRKQLAGLKHLQTTMTQAEIQIESTLSLLSTVYAQILTGQSVLGVTTSGRFLSDVEEEVHQLQDRLEALCEVKGWGDGHRRRGARG